MYLSGKDIEEIYDHCVELTSFSRVYEAVVKRLPRLSPIERREAFLECVEVLLTKGWLEFLGEDQIFHLGELPKVGNMYRKDLAPWLWIQDIIREGRYWECSPEERRVVREKLQFDEEVFRPEELSPEGLKVPSPNTPDTVISIMREKWPAELVPEVTSGDGGFDFAWFEKWRFRWHGRGQRREIRT